MLTPLAKTRERLIADERTAENAVIAAEQALTEAEATRDDWRISTARQAVDQAREKSCRIRQEMVEGLAAWDAYYAALDEARKLEVQ